jgi:hypothetical protein
MRLRTSGARPQDLRVHRLAAKSRPQENESRFVPVQSIPGAKGCWRSLARTRLLSGSRKSGMKVIGASRSAVPTSIIPFATSY